MGINRTALLGTTVLAVAVSGTAASMPAAGSATAAAPAKQGDVQRIRSLSTAEYAALPGRGPLGADPYADAVRPNRVRGVDVGRLRGLATHPGSGLEYTYDAVGDDLLGVDAAGRVVETRDAAGLELVDVKRVAFGPSADPTDDPSVLSLYVADAGQPGADGEVVEATLQAQTVTAASAVTGTLVRTTQTSTYSPPSPDPSGLAYLSGTGRMFISDGEVDEMGIFRGKNLFATTRSGSVVYSGVSKPWSNEPVGVGYNPLHKHLFVSDDDEKEVFEVVAGGDGRFGTSDDTVRHFDTVGFGNHDPEGLDYDNATNSLWIVSGLEADVFRVRPGRDGRFGTSDDSETRFDVGKYGARDPEGLGYDAVRNTVLIVDDGSDTIYELATNGSLLNTIRTGSAGMRAAAGLAVGPSSSGSGRSYYVVARGVDNDSNPTENDGKLYEFKAKLPSTSPKLTAWLSSPTVRVGHTVTMRGSLSPSAWLAPLRLQRYIDGEWVSVQRKTLGSGSTVAYSFSIKHWWTGTYRYRVLALAYKGRDRAKAPSAWYGLPLRVTR